MLPKIITISYIIGCYVRFHENNRFITRSIGYVKMGVTLSIHFLFFNEATNSLDANNERVSPLRKV